eukprot:5132911-Prymnesium_polylepis.1
MDGVRAGERAGERRGARVNREGGLAREERGVESGLTHVRGHCVAHATWQARERERKVGGPQWRHALHCWCAVVANLPL